MKMCETRRIKREGITCGRLRRVVSFFLQQWLVLAALRDVDDGRVAVADGGVIVAGRELFFCVFFGFPPARPLHHDDVIRCPQQQQ